MATTWLRFALSRSMPAIQLIIIHQSAFPAVRPCVDLSICTDWRASLDRFFPWCMLFWGESADPSRLSSYASKFA